MCHVDALSRNPAGEPEETECAAGLLVLANSFEESHVDALSRNPAGEPEETECATGLLVLANSFEESDWLCILQKQDSKIRDIVEILNKETKNTEEEKRVGLHRNMYRMLI
ncbi:hypothetical protein QE152_g5216 [Popillia japonica]|uniref:Uncharacterized protein n=1 Tax=Popillia japonica TaxID=7064 RepID=A0AAW1MIC2_POPJA